MRLFPPAFGKGEIHFPGPGVQGPRLQVSFTEFCTRGDLVIITGPENLVDVFKFFESDRALMHRHTRILEQLNNALAGDAVQESAVHGGGMNFTIPGHEQICIGEFRDVALGVQNNTGVKALFGRLGDGSRDIRVQARCLGFGRGHVFGRSAKR